MKSHKEKKDLMQTGSAFKAMQAEKNNEDLGEEATMPMGPDDTEKTADPVVNADEQLAAVQSDEKMQELQKASDESKQIAVENAQAEAQSQEDTKEVAP